MSNRRLHLASDDDDDEELVPPPRRSRLRSRNKEEPKDQQRKRKKLKLVDEDDEEEEVGGKKTKEEGPSTSGSAGDYEKEEPVADANPIGDSIRVSGKGRTRRGHFDSFEYDGITFELEDPVLLVPEDTRQKPYVAIIKDISQKRNGSVMVTGQWFYRPEEAERKLGGNWKSRDTRELFYSFHRDEVPAESVMHKCVVHFIPLNKQIPRRKQHPGFIVQKVYDTEQKKLFKLTDKDYEDIKQHEIDLLVQKTMSRVGELPDVEIPESSNEQEERNKRLFRKKTMAPLDVSRDDEGTTRSGQQLKPETPGSVTSNTSEYYIILSNFKVLTGETQRDKWLERILQGIQFICTSKDNPESIDKDKLGTQGINGANGSSSKTADGSLDINNAETFQWPKAAVPAVTALEKATHEAFSSDFQKYNQKLRQLLFNLKNNAMLTRRMLKGELEPSKILNMSPIELKEGLTSEELASKQPEESEHMQMADARCKRCTGKKVGIKDIIGERYQLECIGCGNTWFSSRDEASTLTINEPIQPGSVGIAPLATAKFEDVEKALVSPREVGGGDNKSAVEILKKSTEAFIPVLDTQKSLNKSRTNEGPSTTKVED
ncbi:uncharacterized protein LOC124942149 [Impatiens glandulifera]|uniref:uncharacterized protein LOC124942149 n=1 Tax=Impatiens glandulifera TaxID=253017 RepID=UPI001FB12BC4|nr:uncharacterized protein LOC124942149 [Impatiens glandulifera]